MNSLTKFSYRLRSAYQFLMPRFVTEIKDRRVEGQTIVLNNLSIEGSVLDGCHIVLGSSSFRMINSSLLNCTYEVYGGAAAALTLLNFLGSKDPAFAAATLHQVPLEAYFRKKFQQEQEEST